MGSLGSNFLSAQALASPSTVCGPFMALAGLFVWRAGLLPRGISSSALRVFCVTLFSVFIYPIGLFAILVAFFGLGSLTERLFPAARPALDAFPLFPDLFLVTILCAGGMLTVILFGLALAFAVRSKPRRLLLWSFGISASTICVSAVAAIIRSEIQFPQIPLNRLLILHSQDILLFSLAWGVELPIVIGEPLLAALLGHWLYLAAEAWSAEAA